jgi:hypothetical protein
MKRGTPDHPKVKRLMQALRISQATAVGHLELLFHFAASRAPRGDIGKWSDAEIAVAAGWDKDPRPFLAALLTARWVEPARDPYRLVIHDWHEHADQTVQRNVANKGGFVSMLAETSECQKELAFASLARGSGSGRALALAEGGPGGGRKVPLPEPFEMTEAMRDFATRANVDVRYEFGKFKDYHRARRSLHVDWVSAWRYWIRNAVEHAERVGRRQ